MARNYERQMFNIDANKLRLRRSKKRMLFTIALAVLLVSSSLTALTFVNAKTTDKIVDTDAYIMVQPQPVALGQDIFVSMWLDKVPPTTNRHVGDVWEGFMLKITKPDGGVENKGPYNSDGAGGYSIVYTPTMLGEYSFQLSYPGQTLTGGVGYPGTIGIINNPDTVGNTYGPSVSKVVTITVGTEPATSSPINPLPSGYWERPVQAYNYWWNILCGNWLGIGATGQYDGALGNVNPYTDAPLSSHIVWTKPTSFGGQLGGLLGTEIGGGSAFYSDYGIGGETGNQQSNYNTGLNGFKFYPIIIGGRLYSDMVPTTITTGFECIDLATGETLWQVPLANGRLMCGQTYYFKSLSSYGAYSYLWASVGNEYHIYDAWSGDYLFKITNVTSSTMFMGEDGSIIGYYINQTKGTQVLNGVTYTSNGPTLCRWNSSLCIGKTIANYLIGGQGWNVARNSVIPWSNGIEWATPVETSFQGKNFSDIVPGKNLNLGIMKIVPGDEVIILRLTPDSAWGMTGAGQADVTGWSIEAGYSMGGTYAGKGPASLLWIKNHTQYPWGYIYVGPAKDGVYTIWTENTMSWMGYSTKTGETLWGPTTPTDELGGPSQLAYYDRSNGLIYDSKLYTWSMSGYAFCYDLKDGSLIWKWTMGSTGLDTPYGVNPLWIKGQQQTTLAGNKRTGMIMTYHSGHEYGPPLFPGAKTYAVNATTGELIWDKLEFGVTASMAIAYGYGVSYDSYDCTIYCIGKGQSATTVDVAPSINSNTEVLITGTVTDQSPGKTCLGIPAAGTPAIADEYMSDWMNYLYKQLPKPMNATGVPVRLSYIDSNNNCFFIGTTTSDIAGNYAITFTPDISGPYTIIAEFDGTNSYYGSSAQTSMLFNEPTAAPTTQPAVEQEPVMMYVTGAAIAIIVALAIATVVIVMAVKKRP